MAGACRIDARLPHQAEDRVARAERNGDDALRARGRCQSGCTGCRRTRRRRAPLAGRSRRCQYGDSVPMTVHDGRSGGSLATRPDAVASTAGVHHADAPRSIRFMPDPSPGSIGACRADQQRREERADQMDPIGRRVGGRLLLGELPDLRAGKALERARPCLLREQSRAANRRCDLRALDATCSSRARSATPFATRPARSARAAAGLDPHSPALPAAPAPRYTLPCCCAEPETAARRDRSRPLLATRASITSSASVHSNGEDWAIAGFLSGSTPNRVPYCGRSLSKDSDDWKTMSRRSPSMSTTIAVRLCVLESRPR